MEGILEQMRLQSAVEDLWNDKELETDNGEGVAVLVEEPRISRIQMIFRSTVEAQIEKRIGCTT